MSDASGSDASSRIPACAFWQPGRLHRTFSCLARPNPRVGDDALCEEEKGRSRAGAGAGAGAGVGGLEHMPDTKVQGCFHVNEGHGIQ